MQNILLIKLGALGDFIQALGPMGSIRSHHPEDKITLLTTKPFVELAKESRYVDEIWVDSRPRWYDIQEWISLRKKLNEGKFSRVYDLQNNDRTSLYFRLFSPRPEWVGAACGASHRNSSPDRIAGKAFEGHIQTLGLAGIGNVKPDTLEWMKGKGTYKLEEPYVLIVPGCAVQHPEKRWPLENYASLCRQLVQSGYQPVLLGQESEKDILSALKRDVPECLNLMGETSLFDIASLARGAAAAVGNDTGPMHLIAPTGCPTLVLFSGATNPARHAPLGANLSTMQRGKLEDLAVKEVWERLLPNLKKKT